MQHATPQSEPATQPHKPMRGIRVIDLTHVLSGPLATYQFALLGAEVLKIENPHSPDMYRRSGADPAMSEQHMGVHYMGHSADKQSVAIDLKSGRGRELLFELIATAHVVIENFKPGVTGRLGITYEKCKAVNPAIVYCSISGFGQSGPYRDRPALDQIIQGAAGIMAITGPREGPNVRVGYASADTTTGLLAAIATLGALTGALRTGVGCHVDVSMLEANVFSQGPVYSDFLNTGFARGRVGADALQKRGAGGTFRTGDGGEIVVSTISFDQFQRLCHAINRPELADDPRFADNQEQAASEANGEIIRAAMREAFLTAPAGEWESRLLAAGIPVGLVNSVAQVAAHPQLAHREAFTTFNDIPGVNRPWRVINAGYHINHAPVTPASPPPRVGAHTAAVLAGMGYSEQQIRELCEAGVCVVAEK